MIVYHGSFKEVSKPDIFHSRRAVDFGPGFYVTPLFEQAVKWAEKFRRKQKDPFVSKYNFDENAYNELKCLVFDEYSEEWLDYILNCRAGKSNDDYDIVTGGVANDKVFNTVELYFDGLIEKDEALNRLKYEKPNLQICFKTQKSIENYLVFQGSEIL